MIKFSYQKTVIAFLLFIFFVCFFPASARAAATTRFIHADYLSSTTMVTDDQGNIVSQQVYYPYGSVRNSQGDLPTERQYTGQVADTLQTGLYYYNARYYDPQTALFTKSDPLGVLNKYAYTEGNPINMRDSSGYDSIPWEKFWENIKERHPWFVGGRAAISLFRSAHSFIPKQIAKANIPVISDVAAWDAEGAEIMDEYLFDKAWDPNVSFDEKMWYLGETGGRSIMELGALAGGMEVASLIMSKQKQIPFPGSHGGHMLDWRYSSSSVKRIADSARADPAYRNSTRAQLESIARTVARNVPYNVASQAEADAAGRLTQVLNGAGGVCRHQVSFTTGVAEELGFSARAIVFTTQVGIGHATTLVNSGGAYWIVDASNDYAAPIWEYVYRYGIMTNIYGFSPASNTWIPIPAIQ